MQTIPNWKRFRWSMCFSRGKILGLFLDPLLLVFMMCPGAFLSNAVPRNL
jgi:hypothetical protein